MTNHAPLDPRLPAAPRQQAGSRATPSGRELYDQARRRAQHRPPADPQAAATGGPAAPARVAELTRPCLTLLPDWSFCGHTGFEHNTGTRGGQPARTACSVATAAGPCGCRAYTPDGA